MTRYLTINGARIRIDKLSEMARAGDYESAREEENKIWVEVLRNIRDGHTQPKGLASVALTTRNIKFPRGWGSYGGDGDNE